MAIDTNQIFMKHIRVLEDAPIERLYWLIGDVAAMVNEPDTVIRFWETEFFELAPKKNWRGRRQYTKDDIQVIKAIHFLVKDQRFTLEGEKAKLPEFLERGEIKITMTV